MTYTFIARRCDDLPVAVCCRVMGVSTSGFYAWRANPVSDRDWEDAQLTNIIVDIHRRSRCSYGSPRVHADLRLGEGLRCSRKRVERLMRQAGVVGIYRRKRSGCTRRNPDANPSEDLVKRQFNVDGPDRLWVMDVTEHPTGEGKVYLGVVVDAWSRRVVGWSIADHIRSELVVDAVQMAIWRRRPLAGQTIAHSDHGAQGSTRHGPSGVGSVQPACWVQWAPSGMLTTTRSAGVFSTPCRPSCWTSTTGTPGASSPWPSSSGSRLGTTHQGDTHPSRCSAPSPTKQHTAQPRLRHDHHNNLSARAGEDHMCSLAVFNEVILGVWLVWLAPPPSPPEGLNRGMLSEGWGLLLGHQRVLDLATSGDFYMATDSWRVVCVGTRFDAAGIGWVSSSESRALPANTGRRRGPEHRPQPLVGGKRGRSVISGIVPLSGPVPCCGKGFLGRPVSQILPGVPVGARPPGLDHAGHRQGDGIQVTRPPGEQASGLGQGMANEGHVVGPPFHPHGTSRRRPFLAPLFKSQTTTASSTASAGSAVSMASAEMPCTSIEVSSTRYRPPSQPMTEQKRSSGRTPTATPICIRRPPSLSSGEDISPSRPMTMFSDITDSTRPSEGTGSGFVR